MLQMVPVDIIVDLPLVKFNVTKVAGHQIVLPRIEHAGHGQIVGIYIDYRPVGK